MSALRWWLIEVNASGEVVTCVPVDQAAKNGSSWFYVQAPDADAAGRAAFNLYCKARQRMHRERQTAAGNCPWCGRKQDREPGKRCSRCVIKDSEYKRRQLDKAAGKPVAPLDRMVAKAARKAEERAEVVKAAAPSVRLDVLLEVQEAWQNAPTNGSFTKWLADQVAAARGRKVA